MHRDSRSLNRSSSLEPQRVVTKKVSRSSSSNRYTTGGAGSRPSCGIQRQSLSKPFGISGQPIRQSSQYGRLGRSEVKDTRPLADKTFQKGCMMEIISFLTVNGYPNPISLKNLNKPQLREFTRVFEFILTRVDTQFFLPQRFDEYIIMLLRQVGYPYSINKSYFSNVGSNHAWPHVLGALSWVMKAVSLVMFKEDTDELIDVIYPKSDFSIPSILRLRFFNFRTSYSLFMNNKDNEVEEELNEYARMIYEDKGHNVDTDSLNDELAAVSEQYETLSKEKEVVRVNKDTEHKFRQDIDVYLKYIDDCDSTLAAQRHHLTSLDKDSDRKEEKVKAVAEEISSVSAIVEKQTISVADVENFMVKEDALLSDIKAIEREHGNVLQDIWDCEIHMKKVTDDQEQFADNTNRKIRLLFANSHSDTSHETIEINGRKDNLTESLDKLNVLRNNTEENVRALNVQNENRTDNIKQLKDMIERQDAEYKQHSNRIQRRQQEYNFKKEETRKEDEVLIAEVHGIESKITKEQHRQKITKLEIEKERIETKKEFETKVATLKEEIEKQKAIQQDLFDKALDRTKRIDSEIRKYKQAIRTKTEEWNTDTINRLLRCGVINSMEEGRELLQKATEENLSLMDSLKLAGK